MGAFNAMLRSFFGRETAPETEPQAATPRTDRQWYEMAPSHAELLRQGQLLDKEMAVAR